MYRLPGYGVGYYHFLRFGVVQGKVVESCPGLNIGDFRGGGVNVGGGDKEVGIVSIFEKDISRMEGVEI